MSVRADCIKIVRPFGSILLSFEIGPQRGDVL